MYELTQDPKGLIQFIFYLLFIYWLGQLQRQYKEVPTINDTTAKHGRNRK